jgi:putative oxidoreductase
MPSGLRALLRGGSKASARVLPLAQLVTRIVMGHAFVLTGLGKWHNFARTTDFFASLGLPMPAANAAFIASLEVVGGACLILGLGTRLFSALLSATMVVALLTADRKAFVDALTGAGEQGLTDVVPFVFLLFLLWLVGTGAGFLSVDQIVARKLERGGDGSASD